MQPTDAPDVAKQLDEVAAILASGVVRQLMQMRPEDSPVNSPQTQNDGLSSSQRHRSL
jgi:hypothetical protein